MLEQAISDIRGVEAAAALQGRRERRVRALVRAIDRVIFELEELNVRGKDRVPASLRERSLNLLVQVPEGDQLEIRYRTNALMDVLFEAQERLFRLADPGRPMESDEDEQITA